MDTNLLAAILSEASNRAQVAAKSYFDDVLGGEDRLLCGFSWVVIHGFEGKRITGNTKLGKMLKSLGIDQNHNRKFEVWNPSRMYVQNVDTLYEGAKAYAKYLQSRGFDAYADSRLD